MQLRIGGFVTVDGQHTQRLLSKFAGPSLTRKETAPGDGRLALSVVHAWLRFYCLGCSRLDPACYKLQFAGAELAKVRCCAALFLDQQAVVRIAGHDHRAIFAALQAAA